MKIKRYHIALFIGALFGSAVINACKPIQNLAHAPEPWSGAVETVQEKTEHDSSKKTVLIIADSKLTEMFDMLAPFYLFNATERANVYIVAKDKTPILIKRDLFVIPQLTFAQVDSMHLKADVVVIPALSVRTPSQDAVILNFIKSHFSAETKMLAVCDGSSTAAATGLYDGKSITTHASDYAGLKEDFPKPNWIQNVSVTRSGNLFSTAGVSNAVEGSLTVIEELFGNEVMKTVLADVHYPTQTIKIAHTSVAVNRKHILTAFSKVFFRHNKNLGLLLENGMNEFYMAGILDTYGRTLPATFKTFIPGGNLIKTKYGLSLVCTDNNSVNGLDELHVLSQASLSAQNSVLFKKAKLVSYDTSDNAYLFDICVDRISEQYGKRFETLVKVSLDYN